MNEKENSKEISLEENSLEENFTLLEETIGVLENDEISLEDAFRAYAEGMEILKVCNAQIDRVEKKVMKLNEQGELEEL